MKVLMGLPPRLRGVGQVLYEAASQWLAARAVRMAAALSFYTIFSLAPLLIIVIAITGLAFGEGAAQGRIVGQIEDLTGTAGARAVQELVENARKPVSGIVATLFGIATLLFGASGVFGELKDSLNTIWNVEASPKGRLLAILKGRFLSVVMVLGVGFLLLVSLVLSAALTAFTDYAGRLVPVLLPVLHVLDLLVSILGVMALFALLYKLVRDARVAWREVWPGAIVASLLFVLGKLAFGLYLGQSSFASSYGAAASLVVILLWVYYSAQILFFGAELTRVYAGRRRRASRGEQPYEPPRTKSLVGAIDLEAASQ